MPPKPPSTPMSNMDKMLKSLKPKKRGKYDKQKANKSILDALAYAAGHLVEIDDKELSDAIAALNGQGMKKRNTKRKSQSPK